MNCPRCDYGFPCEGTPESGPSRPKPFKVWTTVQFQDYGIAELEVRWADTPLNRTVCLAGVVPWGTGRVGHWSIYAPNWHLTRDQAVAYAAWQCRKQLDYLKQRMVQNRESAKRLKELHDETKYQARKVLAELKKLDG